MISAACPSSAVQIIDSAKDTLLTLKNQIVLQPRIDKISERDLEDAHKPEYDHNDDDSDSQTDDTAHVRFLHDVSNDLAATK